MTRLEERDQKWRDHVAAMVAAAPPLTAQQIAQLGALFNPVPVPKPKRRSNSRA